VSAESPELRDLRHDPFGILQRIEERLRSARIDTISGQSLGWVGLGFRLDRHWFVAPRDDVREVIPPPKTTRVPNSRPWLAGLANVRGELLTIVDLRQLLGLPPAEELRAQRVVVFNSDEMPTGFLVDEVVGHRQFSPDQQRHELVQEAGAFRDYLLGGFFREGQPWLALSLNKVALGDAFRHAGA
jgi:twitching motility protein PilI